jgi:hypothetical protein
MPFKVETWKEQRWIGHPDSGYETTVHLAALQEAANMKRVVCCGEGGTPQAAHAALIQAIKRTHEEHHEAVNAAWRERHVKP